MIKPKGGIIISKIISSCLRSSGRLFLTLLVCCAVAFGFVFFDVLSISKTQIVYAGEQPIAPSDFFGNPAMISKYRTSGSGVVAASSASGEDGEYDAAVSVYGLPVRSVHVQETAPVYVEPGGQSIGILLQTDGVSIVGFSPIVLEDGSSVNPALEAGLEKGDFITTINEQRVNSNDDVAAIIDKAGQGGELCAITYLRNGIKHSAVARPLFCTDCNAWRIGLYVRDNTAGIGTLSFYDPESGKYGALGHEVPDLKYGTENDDKGCIVRASVQGIKQGESGVPGEKVGVFLDEDWQGSIVKNNAYGVFGTLDSAPVVRYCGQTMPAALPSEIETGPAEIYTVIDGENIESFDINIIKCMEGYKLTGKCMVLEVTDKELLKKTGGIVQGMSGSPIIQNGKIVGAVTHVFVNDPTKGYGIYIENMLEAADLVEAA